MSVPFDAVLLAGGKSSRMGHDKAFLEIDRVPLWRRQIDTLRHLWPKQILIAGPARPEWIAAGLEVVPDAVEGAGPLASLVASLRCCSTPLLLALAVDLPKMTADYLNALLARCSEDCGVVPARGDHFEPLAAVYPRAALPIAEGLLRLRRYSLQDFAGSCVAQRFVVPTMVSPEEEEFFLNLNTPDDLAALEHE